MINKPIAVKDKPPAQLTDEEWRTNKIETLFPRWWTSKSLLEANFPPISFIVPGYITQGLTVLAGSPKIGKSWFVLQMAAALSCGGVTMGTVPVKETEVLYLALEDSPPRIANRLKKIGAIGNDLLHVFCEWPSGEKGIIRIREFKKHSPNLKVIFIDTLQRFRGLSEQSYASDYEDLGAIRSLCDELDISIVLVHHTRKMESQDPVGEVSGSHGISGVVDSVLILKKERKKNEATLFVTSRDMEEKETALRFDANIGTWCILGDADLLRLTTERQEIIDIVKENRICNLDIIAKCTGKKKSNLSNMLRKLTEEGYLEREGYGKYKIQEESEVSPVSL